jgi:hypothetical protein
MDGEVANGIELDRAGNHTRLLALEVEDIDRALEMAGVKLLMDRAVVDRDRLRVPLVAVDDAGNAPFAAFRARAALARAASCPRLEFHRLSHHQPPNLKMTRGRKAAPPCVESAAFPPPWKSMRLIAPSGGA